MLERGISGANVKNVNPIFSQRDFVVVWFFCRVRRVVKIQRAIVGATLEELASKRATAKPKPVAADAAAAKYVFARFCELL